MGVQVRIPTPLRGLTGGQALVAVEGDNVSELLASLEKSYPGIGQRLRDEAGNLRRFINIYINEEDIRFLDGLNSPVREDDDVSIIPAVAGG